jgi:L-aminopeptidase/D-esterase-like protein
MLGRPPEVPMTTLALLAVLAAPPSPAPEPPPRARDLGIPFDFGTPGPMNAITDVPGVEVGHVTLVEGGSVRTGVTAILPRGKGADAMRACFAGVFSLNGNGEMTGTAWIEESGFLEGPVLITNTSSVGVVRDAVVGYAARKWAKFGDPWSLPVVAETWDGRLNDIGGMHVKAQHAEQAMEAAAGGAVAEGNVGGGTGMVAFEYKGGIGTASRALSAADGGFTLGVLVQANFGLRHQLRVAGLPVGLELRDNLQYSRPAPEAGSIIIVVATDAPLLAHQVKRLARRAALGLARTGSVAGNGSGDLFVAFSTASPGEGDGKAPVTVSMLPNDRMGPLFEATVGATEEAIVNALVAARTMTGREGRTVHAIPHDRLREILRRHGRLVEPAR